MASAENNTESGKIPTSRYFLSPILKKADLELSRLFDAGAGGPPNYLPACERHWTLREAINATPARTFPELQAKARRPPKSRSNWMLEADCEGLGCFKEFDPLAHV